MGSIRIGTRKSKLALWQAEWVAKRLEDVGLTTELVTMDTKGDKILDVSISKIGSKGVFTEELEEKLLTGEMHIAVHSAKDMQSRLPTPFEIIAFCEREKANDVLVSDQELSLSGPPIIIGTSSTRRIAFLKNAYPQHTIVEMRGNLQTRLEKMRRGDCEAMMLAYAGVHRMGFTKVIKQMIDIDTFVPAVGQGSVAIEASSTLEPALKNRIVNALNHQPTERRLMAERAYLAQMDGGCSIPVFAHSILIGDRLKIRGGIISLDGSEKIEETLEGFDPVELGQQLADTILKAGGDKILAEIKSQLD
ncbi:MAG: hydroxymethylbilane synthase [Cyclobacteriaceae bacterium]